MVRRDRRPPTRRTLGIRDGIVATVSAEPLDETGCPDVIDADGKWIVPGFIDVHTHYDAEVLLDPGLRESVRHGVTTVLLGNCSLSTVYADTEDAADLFSRVEAVPRKFVLGALEAKKTWSTPAEYVQALDELPLGPNVGSMLGHSDLRTSVLGLERATTEDVAADRRRTGADGRAARRGARRGPARHVRDGRADRQARRRPLPVARAAVDLRHVARTSQADQGAAQARPHPAERTQHQEPDRGAELLPDQQPDVRPPPRRPDEPAGVGRRQVRDRARSTYSAPAQGSSTGCSTRSCASSTCPCRSSCTPTASTSPCSRSSARAPPHCTCATRLERNELLADAEYRRRFRRSFDRKKLGPSLWHRDFHDAVIVECPDGP